jgi:hypothetical protein
MGTPHHCSFCRKSPGQVAKLVFGLGVAICNECVNVCHLIIVGAMPQPTPAPAPVAPFTTDQEARLAELVATHIGHALAGADGRIRDFVRTEALAAIAEATRTGGALGRVDKGSDRFESVTNHGEGK